MVALSLSSTEGKRHALKYITPFIGQQQTHKLQKRFEGYEPGTVLTVLETVCKDDKYHTLCMVESRLILIRNSYIAKPRSAVTTVHGKNGVDLEIRLVAYLKEHGLCSPDFEPAGNNPYAKDFYLGNYVGECKLDLKAKFGALTISYDKGWYIPDRAWQKKPAMSEWFEKQNFIPQLNKCLPGEHDAIHCHQVKSEQTSDVSALRAYANDLGFQILHVETHGTYCCWMSEIELPQPSGAMVFRVQTTPRKRPGSAQVQWYVKALDPSPFHLMNKDQLDHFQKQITNK